MKTGKRLLALLLVLAMMLSNLPVGVLASELQELTEESVTEAAPAETTEAAEAAPVETTAKAETEAPTEEPTQAPAEEATEEATEAATEEATEATEEAAEATEGVPEEATEPTEETVAEELIEEEAAGEDTSTDPYLTVSSVYWDEDGNAHVNDWSDTEYGNPYGFINYVVFHLNEWLEEAQEWTKTQVAVEAADDSITLTLVEEAIDGADYYYKLETNTANVPTSVTYGDLSLSVGTWPWHFHFLSDGNNSPDTESQIYDLNADHLGEDDSMVVYAAMFHDDFTWSNVRLSDFCDQFADIEYVNDRLYKITLYGNVRDYVMEDGSIWLEVLSTQTENATGEESDGLMALYMFLAPAPYLTFGWLDNQGEGWYENEMHVGDIYRVVPGRMFFHIYYLHSWDYEAGCMVETPVPVEELQWDGDMFMDPVASEDIRGDQSNGSCFARVGTNTWNQDIEVYTTVNGVRTGGVTVWTNRDDWAVYSEPNMNNDTYLWEFYVDPDAEENAVYAGLDSEYWTAAGEPWIDEGFEEFLTMEPYADNIYKITVTEAGMESVLNGGFLWPSVHIDVSAEDGSTDTLHYNLGILAYGEDMNKPEPYLSLGYLDNWGDGFFDSGEWRHFGTNLAKGDVYSLIFFMNVWDEERGEYVEIPVHPQNDGALVLEHIDEIQEGQENGEYFYAVSATEFDTDLEIYVDFEGNRYTMGISTYLHELDIYTSQEISHDTRLMGPLNVKLFEENAVYLHLNSDSWTATEWAMAEDCKDYATIEQVEGTDDTWKVTITQDGINRNMYQYLIYNEIILTVQNNEDENWYEQWYAGFALSRMELQGHAFFFVDGETYEIFDEGYSRGWPTGEYEEWGEIWDHEVTQEWPETFSYDWRSNTLTLNNYNGGWMQFEYECYDWENDFTWYNLPSDTLTIELIGDNSLITENATAFSAYGGVNLNVVGDGSLYVKTVNNYGRDEEGNACSYNAWQMNGGSLTIRDNASVTVEIAGKGNETIWEGDNCLGERFAHMNVMVLDGANIVLRDNGSLETVIPAGMGRNGTEDVGEENAIWDERFPGGADGIINVGTVSVYGGTLTTQYLEFDEWWDEGNLITNARRFYQTGGTVNLTAQPHHSYQDKYEWNEETQQDEYVGTVVHSHYEALYAGPGAGITINGGTLNITCKPTAEEVESMAWYYGICLRGAAFRLYGGEVNFDTDYEGTAIQVDHQYDENGEPWASSQVYLNGGTINVEGNLWDEEISEWDRSNKSFVHAMEVQPGCEAYFNGTVLNVTRAYFDLHGTVEINGGTINGHNVGFTVNDMTMNGGSIHIDGWSYLNTNGSVEMNDGSIDLELCQLGAWGEFYFNGGSINIETPYHEMVEEGFVSTSLGIGGYFGISDGATLTINHEQPCDAIYVSGTLHQKGGVIDITHSAMDGSPAISIDGWEDENGEWHGGVYTMGQPGGELYIRGTDKPFTVGGIIVAPGARLDMMDGKAVLDNVWMDLSGTVRFGSAVDVTINNGDVFIHNGGTWTVQDNACVTMNATFPQDWVDEDTWPILIGVGEGSTMNVTGGTFTINAEHFNTALLIDGGDYVQTGGTVNVTNIDTESIITGENCFDVIGTATISGGVMNLVGTDTGFAVDAASELDNGKARVNISGGTINIDVPRLAMWLTASTNISGGDINIDLSNYYEEVQVDAEGNTGMLRYVQGVYIYGWDNPDAHLTISGGTIDINIAESNVESEYINLNSIFVQAASADITGGVIHANGGPVQFFSLDAEDYLNLGDMVVYSLNSGKKLEKLPYTIGFGEDGWSTTDPDKIVTYGYYFSFEEDNIPTPVVEWETGTLAENLVIVTGKSGSHTTWNVDDDGLLTFSGDGGMYNYSPAAPAPWYHLRSFITGVEMNSNLGYLGSYAFSGLKEQVVLRFLGKAPNFSANAFAGFKGDARYPAGMGWTTDIMQPYGGEVVWVLDFHTIEVVEILTEDDTLFSGEKTQLTARLYPETDIAQEVVWTLKESDKAYASLSVKKNVATVTAKTVTEKQEVTLYAVVKNGLAEPVAKTVTIYPKAQSVAIYSGETDVSGQKIKFDVLSGDKLELTALVCPDDAADYLDSLVTWDSSNQKIATVEDGVVTFLDTGTVKITATAVDGSKKKATVNITAVEMIQAVEMEADSVEDLVGGKSASFKAVDPDDNYRELKSSEIKWSMAAEFEPYASITAAGKLSTKVVQEAVAVTIVGTLVDNAEVTVEHVVTIHPAVSQVEIVYNGEVVNGDTIYVNTDNTDSIDLTAVLYPDGAMEGVTWKTSGKSIATVDEDGVVTALKAGTVTITATADDGSKKSASVKVQFGVFAEMVEITTQETEWSKAKGTLQMTANVFPNEGLTKSGVIWSLKNAEDKNYATITSAGVLKANDVYAPQEITVVATSKDGCARDEYLLTIVPSNDNILVIKSGEDYVTKTTQVVDLNGEAAITLSARDFATGDAADVTWSPLTTKFGTITENEDGSLTVTLNKATTLTFTAKDADGRKATVSVKSAYLASGVTVVEKTSNSAENLTLASGKTMNLKATVAKAANSAVTWSVEPANCATISSAGKLTAAANLTSAKTVYVTATAKDGSGKYGTVEVTLLPLSQGIEIHGLEGELTNCTVTYDMPQGEKIQLEAQVYPIGARSDVTWKSSSAKVAAIDPVTGEITCLNAGTATITATANDGSGKKATFKLTVVKKMTQLVLDKTVVVAGGKSLPLAAAPVPSDATNKNVTWTMTGDTAYATLSSKGVLKTSAVTAPKTLYVTATALDGSGVSGTCVVTIYPATTSVQILSEGAEVTGKTLELAVGKTLTLEGFSLPLNAAGTYTWKSSKDAWAEVDEDGVVTGSTVGKTVTITCTAADGSNKSASVKIKIVAAK